MSDNTNIEWTDASWPVVTGCTHISSGCDHCYAAKLTSGRLKHQVAYAGLATAGKFTGEIRLLPDRLDWPLHWRKPRKIFVSDMADLFHQDVPDEYIARVFAVMAATPRHTYQVLTKRHARLRALLSSESFPVLVRNRMFEINPYAGQMAGPDHRPAWPLPNVWLGVSAENQHWADIRIPALVETPAAVRFLSCEPLLGPVDLSAWMPPGIARWQCGGCKRFYSGPLQKTCPGCGRVGYWCGSHKGNGRPGEQPLGWVIVGGESGPGARPMIPDWARELRDQSTAAGVPFFFKQWGAWAPTGAFGIGGHDPRRGFVGEPKDPHGCREEIARVGKKAAGRLLDGREWNEYPA